ncbi:putative Alpha-actinin A [Paratrimastix pyriformis]|uniref:Alpha-actinin A n=1 Tax=Paratrimastix pyriformis TaxID=342808 RepID=A0ABQ8U4V7_9EUKA|nr:putative Alpha-actinin A [Paratrimastix pyriformis]
MSASRDAWITAQKRAFTGWMNIQLAKRNIAPVNDIFTDLEDGVALCQLAEIILDCKIKYTPRERIKMVYPKLENINFALQEMKKKVFVSAEPAQIRSGDPRMILGMLWTLILRIQVSEVSIEQKTAKEGLLLWCQRKTAGYRDVAVRDFTNSWKDGLALCALIHKHYPALIPFDTLTKANAVDNLNMAFEVALREWNIPKMLDANEMVQAPDELSVVTYLTQFFHAFSKSAQSEVASRRVTKLVELTQSNDEMKADYERRATELVAQLKEAVAQMEDRSFDNTLAGAIQKMKDFENFKSTTKPALTSQKLEVETIMGSIAMKLRTCDRPPFHPAEEIALPTALSRLPATACLAYLFCLACLPLPVSLALMAFLSSECSVPLLHTHAAPHLQAIEALYAHMEEEEAKRGLALREELMKQKKLASAEAQFEGKISGLEHWVADKKIFLDNDNLGDTLGGVQNSMKMQEAFEDEFRITRQAREVECERLAEEMLGLHYQEVQISERLAALKASLDALHEQSQKRKAALEQARERELEKERLRKEFAAMANEAQRWLRDTHETIQDHTFPEGLQAITDYRAKLDSDNAAIESTFATKLAAMTELDGRMTAAGITDNKYTALRLSDMNTANESVKEQIVKRDEAYRKELEHQQTLDEKCRAFAEGIKTYVDLAEQQRAQVEALMGPLKSATALEPLEEGKTALEEHKARFDSALGGLDDLAQMERENAEAGVRENPHTPLTVALLRTQLDDHAHFLRENATFVALEIHRLRFAKQADALAAQLAAQHSAVEATSGTPEACAEALRAIAAQGEALVPEVDALAELERQGTALGVTENRHTRHTAATLRAQWEDHVVFVKEAITTQLAEGRRLLFARAAEAFAKAVKDQRAAMEALAGEPQARIVAIEELYQEGAAPAAQLEELRAIDGANRSEFGITENKHTSWTLRLLESLWTQHTRYVSHALTHLRKEVRRLEWAHQAEEYARAVEERRRAVEGCQGSLKEQADAIRALTTAAPLLTDQLAALAAADQENREQHGIADNTHTKFTLAALQAMQARLDRWVQERLTHLDLEERRVEFAQKATAFAESLAAMRSQIEAIAATEADTLEARIEKVTAAYGKGAALEEPWDELGSMDRRNSSVGITSNTHTTLTIAILGARKAQLGRFVETTLGYLNDQVFLRDRSAKEESEIAAKEKRDAACIDFAQKAIAMNTYMESIQSALAAPMLDTETLGDAQQLKEQFETVVLAGHQTQKPAFEELRQSHERVVAEGVTANPFCHLTMEALAEKWEALEKSLDERKERVAQELERQEVCEGLRRSFAEKATALAKFCADHKKAFADLAGDLQAQLAEAKSREAEIDAAKDEIVAEVQKIAQELSEMNVTINEHTDLDVYTVKAMYEALVNICKRSVGVLEQRLVAQKMGDITPEELAEFRECFDHFDQDHSGDLQRLEFKACLASLGQEVADEQMETLWKQMAGDRDCITFDSFTQYMKNRTKDTDSKEEVVASFKEIAKDKPFVTADDLRGANLEGKHVEYLSTHMPPKEAGFDYEAFTEQAFTR